MSKLVLLTYVLCLTCLTSYGQGHIPLEEYYRTESNRIIARDSSLQTTRNQHTSIQPLQRKRTDPNQLFKSEGKYYYWITQKLFKEHFIQFIGENYWMSIDPIIDLELGTDLSSDSSKMLYWNTRGFRVQGEILEKVSFSSEFYENQAILPNYQQHYVNRYGEFFPNAANTTYQQQNAVIPGYARTKSFKLTGYDFAFATGNITYEPNSFFNFTIGNGNHKIGNGYRSLLLSDYTVNYPFAQIETNFWQDRIQYNVIYALHQNLYRLHTFSTPEATYERKIGTYHYLDIALTEKITLGLFEAAHWKRVDSLGSHQPDYLFINPVPFVNYFVKGDKSEGYNALLGLNFVFKHEATQFYSQLVFDQNSVGAYQIGLQFLDVLVDKLDFLIEYNHAAENTYTSDQKRYNFSHFNLPIAHPYTNGFDEIIGQISYQHNRFFIQNRINYSKRISNTANLPIILNPTMSASQSNFTHIIYNQFEIGYRFNRAYNLQMFAGHLYRNETMPSNNPLTNYAYLGLRTRLKNKYIDY
ncbi:hypothetical protein [Crocinitomix algicola]|uniref:hypothetical protein n=1 Tax=Crocinitomix algicola TaxID=1740263 RepID=UPI0008732FCD|nr:hypothetical protein [Crocinitomix algicola]